MNEQEKRKLEMHWQALCVAEHRLYDLWREFGRVEQDVYRWLRAASETEEITEPEDGVIGDIREPPDAVRGDDTHD